MANTSESKFLKAALENIDAVAAKLQTKIEDAVQKAKDTALDADSTLSELKYLIENQVIKLGSMNIPVEVYQKFGESVYEKINGSSELENYSSDDNSIKKIWKKITNAISDIPDTNVAVNVTDENGNTRTVNYSINFVWSFSLFGLSVVRAKISNDTDSVNVIFTDNIQETLVKYCAALKQLDNKLMNKVWTKVSEIFLSDEDQAVAKDLIDVIYSDASATSKLKKVFGSTLLKNIDKDEIKSKINELLGNDSDKQLAANYETLNNLYNEMENLISAGQDVTAARAQFVSISQSILESDFVALPDPASEIQYNSNLTEITIPATFGNTISATDYNSKVKKIDATAFSSNINLTGNSNANIIYGGSGSDIINGGAGKDTIYGGAGDDTLSGGKGNDTLTGSAGADVFIYSSGDGNDVITDYTAGEDFIKIADGTVSNYSVKGGKDAILTIGKGKVTLKGAGNDAISVVTADNATVTYGGISDGLNYNKDDFTKSTAVTINSAYEESYAADYSSLVTLNASSRNNSIEITGNAKNNKILGGSGGDTIYGENGKDSIYGGKGADKLFGGAGNDKLFGENGNDTLNGGAGKDTLTGGAGNDVFYYAKGDGADVITDYTAGDKIYIDGANSVKGSIKGNDVTFKIGSGSVKLQKAKNIEVTIEYSNGTQGTYLNGELISTSEISNIPADAVNYNGHYYKIYSNEDLTWENAQQYCESRGGYLAVINDSAENEFLFDYMKDEGYESAYFGLSDAESEGNWSWVNGDALTYTNWASGEPNGGTSENYAMFFQIFTEGQWNDANPQNNKAPFICEWDNSAVSARTAEIFYDDNFIDDTNIDSLIENNFVGELSFDDSNNTLAQDSFILSCNNKNIDNDLN